MTVKQLREQNTKLPEGIHHINIKTRNFSGPLGTTWLDPNQEVLETRYVTKQDQINCFK